MSSSNFPEIGTWADDLTSTTALVNDRWYHIVATYDGSVTLKLYINGILDTTKTLSSPLNTILNSDGVNLGSWNPGAISDTLNGYIDEVKIYAYARTADQVKTDYLRGSSAGGSSVVIGNNTTAQPKPISDYRFDEQQGQTVNNNGNSDNAINGTLGANDSAAADDPTWKTKEACKINGCLYFDGGDYVSFSSSAQFSPSSLSVGTWFKTNMSGGAMLIRNRFNGYGLEIGNYLTTSASAGQLTFWVYDNTTKYDVTSTKTYNDNLWHYVAGVYDGSSVQLYIDGEKAGTAAAGSIFYNGNAFAIGRDADNNGGYFTGYIDEPKIWNSALNESQIKTDFNQASAIVLGAQNEAADLSDGAGNPPILNWTLDDKTGSSVNDISGNNFTATNVASPIWQPASKCHFGSCLLYNGTTQYSNRSTVVTNSTGNFTMQGWFNRVSNSPTGENPFYNGNTGTNGYGFIISDGNCGDGNEIGVLLGGRKCDAVNSTTNMELNRWYFLTLTHTGTTWSLYINGAFAHSGTNAVNAPSGGGGTFIGSLFNGYVDDVKMYDYVRTPAQIAYDYNRGGPMAWYKMDECEGSIIHDASGNNNTATFYVGSGTHSSVGTCATSNTTWGSGTAGKYNSALSFDASDDYLVTPLTTTQQRFTIGAWVKNLNPGDDRQTIISKSSYFATAATDFPFDLYATGAGTSYVVAIDSGSNFVADLTVQSPAIYPIDTWHHVVATYDGATLILYVDGQEAARGSGAVTLSSNARAYTLGRSAFEAAGQVGTTLLSGYIDDARIYNYALSPTQIKKLYNQNSAVQFTQ